MSLGRESWQEVVADKVAEVILETLYERPPVSLLTIRFILEVTKNSKKHHDDQICLDF